MSDNIYDEEFTSEQDNEQEEKKKKWVIPVSILSVIALIAVLIFFFFNREEETEEPPVEETTSASVVPTDDPDKVGVDPSTTEEPETVTQSSEPEVVEDEEDTFFTGQAEPRYQEEPATPLPTTGNKELERGHINPFDPKAGRPRETSQFAVQNMFTIQPSKDGSYREHFDESMGDYISPQMKRTGFKPWWGADEPEHTPFYQTLAATPGSKIYNQIELKEERRTANDMVEYRYTVQPRVINESGYTNIADFEIIIQMIGNEEGTWLMNDYYFPEGRVPPLH